MAAEGNWSLVSNISMLTKKMHVALLASLIKGQDHGWMLKATGEGLLRVKGCAGSPGGEGKWEVPASNVLSEW